MGNTSKARSACRMASPRHARPLIALCTILIASLSFKAASFVPGCRSLPGIHRQLRSDNSAVQRPVLTTTEGHNVPFGSQGNIPSENSDLSLLAPHGHVESQSHDGMRCLVKSAKAGVRSGASVEEWLMPASRQSVNSFAAWRQKKAGTKDIFCQAAPL